MKFYGLHNETYETYEEVINHYKPICEELRQIYDLLNTLPNVDSFWSTPVKDSLKTVLEYIGGNTENEEFIPE